MTTSLRKYSQNCKRNMKRLKRGMCATTSGTTSWAMSMLSSGKRRMQSGLWLNSITAGSMGRLCMPSCLLSLTSGSHAAGSMRWGSAPEVASATSCTCDQYPGISGGSFMGGDPGTGHPQGHIQATVPEKGTNDIPQTTSTDASETGVLARHSGVLFWPGSLLSAPFLQFHHPRGHSSVI